MNQNSTISRSALSLALAVGLCTSAFAQDPAAPQGTTEPAAAASVAPDSPDASSAKTDEQKERLISLVLLLKSPRQPSHEMIAHAVSEGLGVKIDEQAVVTKPPYHLVSVDRDKFIINDIDQPYFEQNEKVASEIKNPNLSRAVREHRAWISVDWVSNDQQPDLREIYQMIGKMVAHLSGDDTLAIYSPDMDRFALWAPTVRQGLESNDPLSVFEPAGTGQEPAQTSSAPSASPGR